MKTPINLQFNCFLVLLSSFMSPLHFHYEDVSCQDLLLKPNHTNVMEVLGSCEIRLVISLGPPWHKITCIRVQFPFHQVGIRYYVHRKLFIFYIFDRRYNKPKTHDFWSQRKALFMKIRGLDHDFLFKKLGFCCQCTNSTRPTISSINWEKGTFVVSARNFLHWQHKKSTLLSCELLF